MNKNITKITVGLLMSIMAFIGVQTSAKEAVPAPTITSPINQSTISSPVVTITGKATAGNTIQVKMNGKYKTLSTEDAFTVDENGNFSVSYELMHKKGKKIVVRVYSVSNTSHNKSAPAEIVLTLENDFRLRKYSLSLDCDPTASCVADLDDLGSPVSMFVQSDGQDVVESEISTEISDNNTIKYKLHKNTTYHLVTSKGYSATFTTGKNKSIYVPLH